MDTTLLSRLYSLCNFLRTGGNFLKMLRAVPTLVQRQCRIVAAVSLQGTRAGSSSSSYSSEVLSYLADHWKQADRSRRELFHGRDDPGSDKGLRQYRQALDEFAQIFNGDWTQHGVLVHRCRPGCCRNADESRSRMCNALLSVVFRNVPAPPAANKWTKLGPAGSPNMDHAAALPMQQWQCLARPIADRR